MDIHSRHTRMLAVLGVLALGASSAVRAQDTTSITRKDTSAAARSDTSGYRSYQRSDTLRSDSSRFKYKAPPTDTTLKAKPGTQTAPTAGDTANAAGQAAAADTATVVCKDRNKMVGAGACDIGHGGIDSVATKAAKNARGQTVVPDTRDTSSSSQQQ
jgi:hypothetical protein